MSLAILIIYIYNLVSNVNEKEPDMDDNNKKHKFEPNSRYYTICIYALFTIFILFIVAKLFIDLLSFEVNILIYSSIPCVCWIFFVNILYFIYGAI
jgi:hypothetical protein